MDKKQFELKAAHDKSSYVKLELEFAGKRIATDPPLEFNLGDISHDGNIEIPEDQTYIRLHLDGTSVFVEVKDLKNTILNWNKWRIDPGARTPQQKDEQYSITPYSFVIHGFAQVMTLLCADLEKGARITQGEVLERLGNRLDSVKFIVNMDNKDNINSAYIVEIETDEVLYRGYNKGVKDKELPCGWQALTSIDKSVKYPDWEKYQNDYLDNK